MNTIFPKRRRHVPNQFPDLSLMRQIVAFTERKGFITHETTIRLDLNLTQKVTSIDPLESTQRIREIRSQRSNRFTSIEVCSVPQQL